MLLMQAQENGVVLDEEQLLFIAGGQTNMFDDDVDEAPVQDLAIKEDNIFQANQYLIHDEAGLSYDSDNLSKVQDHDNYIDSVGEYHDVHEMQNNVQPNYVVTSDAEYTSDSNIILLSLEKSAKNGCLIYSPKILHFEEPDESQVNTGSTLSAQVNTAEVNTAELNAVSTPSAQVNTAEVNTAALNTGETERVQRRKGKDPMTEEDLQAEVQASKKSKELQELADLEEAQRLQAKMDAETQRQIDLDALLARRVQEQEEEAAREALATEFDYIQARLNADQILAEKIQQEEREQYSIEERAKFLHDTIAAQRKFLAEQRSAAIRNKPPTISQLRNQMITYLKHVANKKHAELKSKSFEEIQVLYERYKKQDQTFVAIGSEEDERAIKKMNEKDADKEEEKKDESVHEEVQEEEGAKKRKLGTRRKLKAKRRKHASSLTREDDDLKICLHIAPDEDKVIDVESLNQQYPIIEWQSFFLTTKPQHDQTKPDEDIYLNKVTRSNGHQRFFRTLMGVLSILDREDLKVIYELVMEEYKDRLPEGFDRMLWGDLMIMFNQGDTADFWDTQQDWNLISWKLHSSSGLETKEESSMALELIKFVKQQLEEFEDSNDDDKVTSAHERQKSPRATAACKDLSNPFLWYDNLPKIYGILCTMGGQNRGQGNYARGVVAARNKGAQNRVSNTNPSQAKQIKCYNCNADQCDAFDSDVDEAPTAQTMFMVNLSSADPIYDEAGPSYDSDIQSKLIKEFTALKKDFKQKENKHLEEFLDMKQLKEKVKDKLYKQDQSLQTMHMLCKPKPFYDEKKKVPIGYKNPLYLTKAKQVQPALYKGYELVKTKHAPAIVHHSEDTLEIAETTRMKMLKKSKKGQRGFEQTKECYLTEVIPFFKMLKEYFKGIQTTLVKEVKEMKEIFEQMEAKVEQNVVDKKCADIERKNLLIENENLIADCLSNELLYGVMNDVHTLT
ncbi:hypothetical protein Tco_1336432 [Tanacetum coccineum]